MQSRWYWLIPPIFILSFALGCLLGFLAPEKEEPAAVMQTSAVNEETTQETTLETTPPVTQTPEEKLYAEYLKSVKAYQETELSDLDGDGTLELLIYGHDSLIEIAAIVDGTAVQVLREYGMFRCADGIILRYSEGAGGHTGFFYQIRDGQAEAVECLVYHWHEDAWYRSTDCTGNDASLVPISDAERHAILEKYPCVDKNTDSDLIKAIYE